MRLLGLFCLLVVSWPVTRPEESEEPPIQKTDTERAAICDAFFRKMGRRVSFEFDETPLSEALTFIQTLNKVSVIGDSMHAAEGKITLRRTDVPIAVALDEVLSKAALDWTIGVFPRFGVDGNEKLALYISTPDRVKAMNERYPDVAEAVTAFREKMREQERTGRLAVTKDGLLLEIERPREVEAGKPLILRVSVTNKSGQPATFLADRSAPPYGRFLRLSLKDSDGREPTLTEKGVKYTRNLNLPRKTVWLRPGETAKDTITLTELYDLGPGAYHLGAVRSVNEHMETRTHLVIEDCAFRITNASGVDQSGPDEAP